jgi:malonyl-CoA/methylmalonyl-CoA synthetase
MTSSAANGRHKLVGQRFEESWSHHPGRRCLGIDGEWLSAGALLERTTWVAANLAARGIGRGERVVWEATTTLDAVVVALGVVRSGAILVPVNVRQSDLERATVIEDVTAALIVGDRSIDGSSVPLVSAADLCTPNEEGSESASVSGDDPALIIFTSGTTGSPKGAVLSHANVAAQIDALEEAWAWTPEDRLLSALPLFHVHGLVVALFSALAVGGSISLKAHFDAESFLDAVVRDDATMSFCVPTMLHRMAMQPSLESVASLRLLVSGSAPLSVELFDAFKDAGATILERYGMTESLLTFSNPLDGERRAGTVGFPLPGVAARLPDPGDGDAELVVAGPGIFAGYWNRPDATAEVLVDGWLSTGDLVRRDADGYTIICGRSKELIITGGFNVYPTEVEDVVRSQPGIVDAAVVGVPNPEWGEEVVAFIVADGSSVDEALLRSRLAELLSSYKIPRRFVVVDALPRNDLGKLQRHLLR